MKISIRRSVCICLLLVVFCFSAQAVLAAQKININKATATELMVLKGVGVKVAANIISYREDVGAFKTIAELVEVKGIGQKIFARIADQITVDTGESSK